MSNLYRSAIGARLAKLPPDLPATTAPWATNIDDDQDEHDEHDGLGALPGPIPTRRTTRKHTPNASFAPISAAAFFAQAVEVSVSMPLSDTTMNFRVYYTPPKQAGGTVMVCHHGAGYSGLSFACFAKEVSDMTQGELGVLAFDARRHGKTTSSGPDENLSIDVLSTDLFLLLQTLFPEPSSAPTFLLVGHSMGGAVIVRTSSTLLEHKYKVAGIAVLDVVEGSAIEALPNMHAILNARPDGFDSPEEAVEWHVTTNSIRNPTSARISVPSIITAASRSSTSPFTPSPAYTWRTPLRSTAPYWSSWFTGLSSSFLAARTARLLVLAGTDRLDRTLMIGQMQGKFQMEVVPGTGHMLHEDNPTRLAEILVEFWRRNERVAANVKKVGEL